MLMFEKGSPKFTNESRILVTYNERWYPVQTKNLMNEDICNLGGSMRMLDRDEVSIFGEVIHYDQDSIPFVGCG